MASSDKPRIAVLEFKNKADNSYFVDDGALDLMLGNSGPENSGGQTGSSGDLSVVGEVSVNGAISGGWHGCRADGRLFPVVAVLLPRAHRPS